MSDASPEIRREVAAKALSYKNGQLSYEAFMEEVDNLPYEDDDLIGELIVEIREEPKRGGFFGISEEGWEDYERGIYQLIDELSSDSRRQCDDT